MNRFEMPVLICRTFEKENILTASFTAAESVEQQLKEKAGLDLSKIQTVSWTKILQYK